MFSRFSRGRQGPHILLIRDSEGPIRLDEARLVAWAKALGQMREADSFPVRPHRGQLPDVDFSRAEPAARGPSLLVRMTRRVLARWRPRAGRHMSGADKASLGKPTQ